MNPTEQTFTYRTDAGHGWLEVPYSVIDLLDGLDISTYSYQCDRRQCGYFEEDLDMGVFIRAFESKFGAKPKIKEVYSKTSFVRSLPSYKRMSPILYTDDFGIQG